MTRSAHASSAYEEAHRGADSLFPRDLWDRGQADLERITETFRALASKFETVLRLNPSVKFPHPGRSLVKRVGNAEVRVELALTNPKGGFPERPEEFEYTLSVFRTPRRNPLRAFLERRDPTEWREIRRYAPGEVREAGAPLRDALEAAARDAFGPAAGESV